jgi:hypothetical protein
MKRRHTHLNEVEPTAQTGKSAENARQLNKSRTKGNKPMTTTTTTDLKMTRLATAAALCDAGAQLTALTADAGEFDLDLDMLAVKKLAAYMQIKGAEMTAAIQIDVSNLGATEKAANTKAPVPDQLVGRRPGRIDTAEGARVERAKAHFAQVLPLLGAAACRTLQPSLAQDLVLMAHTAALNGLEELNRIPSESDQAI